jgi:hypothetical protein
MNSVVPTLPFDRFLSVQLSTVDTWTRVLVVFCAMIALFGDEVTAFFGTCSHISLQYSKKTTSLFDVKIG